MPRLRRYFSLFVILLLATVICGKLLLTPICCHPLYDGQSPRHPNLSTFEQKQWLVGWPWVFRKAMVFESLRPLPARMLSFYVQEQSMSLGLLAADIAVCLFMVLLVVGLSRFAFRRLMRGKWQFSLRGMFAIVTLAALALGWWTYQIHLSEQQQQLRDRLQAQGFAFDDVWYVGPDWLRRLWPAEDLPQFHRPVTTRCRRPLSNAGIAQLSLLKQMPSIRRLEVTLAEPGRIDDVQSLGRIEYLQFSGPTPDTDTLRRLAKASPLRSLAISGPTSDETIVAISECRSLSELLLSQAVGVTDEGIAELVKLPQLRDLRISGAQMTDRGMEELANITSLQSIVAGSDQVTEAGARQLLKLTNLQRTKRNTIVTGAKLPQDTQELLWERIPNISLQRPLRQPEAKETMK